MHLLKARGSGTAANIDTVSQFTGLSDTAPADTADTAWGTETLTFDNPGGETTVVVMLTGVAEDFDRTATNARCKPQVSFDGGATWVDPSAGNSGWQAQANLPGASATDRVPLSAQFHHTATPTGDVVVRARCQSASAAGGSFIQGALTAQLQSEAARDSFSRNFLTMGG